MAVLDLPVLAPRARAVPAPNATLSARVDLTDAVAKFRIRADEGTPPFQAGQYFAMGLPHEGRLLQRPYSTTSSPGTPGDLEFLVRLVPGGGLTPRLWLLEPGARLHLGRPKGVFTVEPDDDRAHLFISTGTGLAPFISMLHELTRRANPPRIVVLHGATHPAELAYRGWLEQLAAERGPALRYVPAISRPRAPGTAGWAGEVGRLDAVLPRLWDTLGLQATATVAYLCGNPGMIAGTVRTLLAAGVPDDSIRREEYWAPIRTVGG